MMLASSALTRGFWPTSKATFTAHHATHAQMLHCRRRDQANADHPLPEGTAVTVSCKLEPAAQPALEKKRVEFPLVRTGTPGTWNLTNERIAEILDEEDIAAMKGIWNVPS